MKVRLGILGVLAALTGACGGQLTDDQILAANGAAVSGSSDAGAGAEPGAESGSAAASGTVGGPSGGAVAGPVAAGPGGTGAGVGPAVEGASPVTGGSPESGAVGTPGETGPIVIGSVGNYSGPAGAAQAGIPRAVQVWAAHVNSAGGLFGRDVQVIVQDDGGDPARYAAAVQDLVENRGVIAFVGQGAALSLQGGTAYLEQTGVPVIGSDCSRNEWWASSVYFPQCATFESYITSVMRMGPAVTNGQRRFGYLYCGEAAACTSADAFAQRNAGAAGVELVYRASVSLTQIDFTAECQNAQRAGVEILSVFADPNTLSRVARSCDRQGYHPQFVQGAITTTVDTVSGPGLGNVAVTMPVFPFEGGSGAAIEEFDQAMAQFVGAPPGPADAYGWAAAKLFELAATRAAQASGSLSSATLLEAMHTIAGETLGGLSVPLDFSGATAAPADCYFVVQGDGGGGWATPLGAEPRCV